MFLFLATFLFTAFTNADEIMHEERPKCLVDLSGCGTDDVCIPIRNDRDDNPISVFIPSFCGNMPLTVIDAQGGMMIVKDPYYGNVSTIPAKTTAGLYPPTKIDYTIFGEPVEQVVTNFAWYARAYGKVGKLVPLDGLSHWIYQGPVSVWNCAKQQFTGGADRTMMVRSTCNVR